MPSVVKVSSDRPGIQPGVLVPMFQHFQVAEMINIPQNITVL